MKSGFGDQFIDAITGGPKIKDLEKRINEMEESGFIEDPYFDKTRCMDLSHNPPTHLCIPPGKIYVHVCPRCKQKTTMSNLTTY